MSCQSRVKGLLAGVAAVGVAAGACTHFGGEGVGGHEPRARTVEYGPRSAEGINRGENVRELFGTLGAPYATYTVGETVIYRWGHGIDTQEAGGQVSRKRDELLVTTSPEGKILDVSYKNKIDLRATLSVVQSVPH